MSQPIDQQTILQPDTHAIASSASGARPSQRVLKGRETSSPWVSPRLSLNQLQDCYKESPWHKAAVDAKRDAVVGYEIGLKPARRLRKGAIPDEKQRDTAQSFLDGASPDGPIEDVLKAAWLDYENVGFFTLEVARNTVSSLPQHLFYVPAAQTRIHRSEPRVQQRIGEQKMEFWLYGAPGRPDGMNEIMRGMAPNFLSAFYGLPEHLTVVSSIVGDCLARNFNLTKFKSRFMSPWALVFEGQIGEKARAQVEDYFEAGVESGEFPKPLLLETGTAGAKATWQRLSEDIKDASFTIYRKLNRDEILAVHRVPPNKVCLFSENKYQTASEQSEGFRDEVITPRQRRLEWHFNKIFVELGVTDWELCLPVADLTEAESDANRALIVARTGVAKVDEIRAILGLDPLGPANGGNEFVKIGSGAAT